MCRSSILRLVVPAKVANGFSILVTLCLLTSTQAAQGVTYDVPFDIPPPSLNSGDLLHLREGGSLPNGFSATTGSTLNIRGGTVGAFAGSFGEVNISGGTVGSNFSADGGAVVAITGGNVEHSYRAEPESTTLLVGGSVGILFNAKAKANIQLFGADFTLGGNPVEGLSQSGDTVEITQRNGLTLAGTLSEGTPIEFQLNTGLGTDTFHSDAILKVTLFLPGDFDLSGVVDQDDYTEWKRQYGNSVASHGEGADANFDGVVTGADYTLWRDNLGNHLLIGGSLASATEVPEPATLAIAVLCLGLVVPIRRRGRRQ